MKLWLRCLVASCLVVLAACGGLTARPTPDALIDEYGVAVRWNEFDKAWAFVDPDLRAAQALSDLERERFKQVQVTGYEVKRRTVLPDGNIEQTVEIRLVNRNTQIERTMVDHQTWRNDAVGKHYWLTSGLPDFSAR